MLNIGIEIQNDVNQKIVFPNDLSQSLNLNQNKNKKNRFTLINSVAVYKFS